MTSCLETDRPTASSVERAGMSWRKCENAAPARRDVGGGFARSRLTECSQHSRPSEHLDWVITPGPTKRSSVKLRVKMLVPSAICGGCRWRASEKCDWFRLTRRLRRCQRPKRGIRLSGKSYLNCKYSSGFSQGGFIQVATLKTCFVTNAWLNCD